MDPQPTVTVLITTEQIMVSPAPPPARPRRPAGPRDRSGAPARVPPRAGSGPPPGRLGAGRLPGRAPRRRHRRGSVAARASGAHTSPPRDDVAAGPRAPGCQEHTRLHRPAFQSEAGNDDSAARSRNAGSRSARLSAAQEGVPGPRLLSPQTDISCERMNLDLQARDVWAFCFRTHYFRFYVDRLDQGSPPWQDPKIKAHGDFPQTFLIVRNVWVCLLRIQSPRCPPTPLK